jgi:hypothetical protein
MRIVIIKRHYIYYQYISGCYRGMRSMHILTTGYIDGIKKAVLQAFNIF